MREKMLEMKELKEELAFAQSVVNRARKLNNVSYEPEERRGKSLDSWESDGNVLVEKSVKPSSADCSLQTNMAEFDKIKHEFALLQVNLRELMHSSYDHRKLKTVMKDFLFTYTNRGHRDTLQELRVTLESELAKSKTYSVAVEETLSEAVSDLEAKTLENLNLKADLENALKESDLKSAKLADIENECAALVSSYLLRH